MGFISMSYRPIYPNNQGRSPEGTFQTPSAGSITVDEVRRRATTACLACKRRKIKCSGRPSPCDPCKVDSIECIVDLSLDGRRKFSVKRIQDDLDVHRRALYQVLRLLEEPEAQKLREIAPLLHNASSIEQIAKHLEESSRRRFNCERPINEYTPWAVNAHSRTQDQRSSTDDEITKSANLGSPGSGPADADCSVLIFRLQTASEDEAISLLNQLRHRPIPPPRLDTLAESNLRYESDIHGGAYNLQAKMPTPPLTIPTPSQSGGNSPMLSAKLGAESMHLNAESPVGYGRSTAIASSTNLVSSLAAPPISQIETPSSEASTYSDQESRSIYLKMSECSDLMQKRPALYTDFAERLDDHIISVVVLCGWGYLKREVALDPQFEVIELWDRVACSKSSPVDRLGTLRMLRRVAKYFAAPDESRLHSIPKFFHPQPWQKIAGTPQVLNYVAW